MALAAAGFFCMGMAISGQHWCFSVFVLPVEADFGWTRSQINRAYSVGMVSGGLVAPLWGRALDRHGPRYVLALAEAIIGSGWLLRSQSRSLPVFYASYALAFLGLPGPVLAVPRALAAAFPSRKGSVIGFATTGASAMSMVLVPAADAVISSYGWPTACLMFALTNAMAVVVALLAFDSQPAGAKPALSTATAAAAGKTASGRRSCCGSGGGGGGGGGICTVTFALVATACNIGQLSYAAVGGSLVPCEWWHNDCSQTEHAARALKFCFVSGIVHTGNPPFLFACPYNVSACSACSLCGERLFVQLRCTPCGARHGSAKHSRQADARTAG
jgi:MFS family permease